MLLPIKKNVARIFILFLKERTRITVHYLKIIVGTVKLVLFSCPACFCAEKLTVLIITLGNVLCNARTT